MLLAVVTFLPGASAQETTDDAATDSSTTETRSGSACVETSYNYIGARPGECLAIVKQIVDDITDGAHAE